MSETDCMKCKEPVFGQNDFNQVFNVKDECVGVLCDKHMDRYIDLIEDIGLPPDFALATVMRDK